ncbi:OLC1v1020862C6 [Oldenlandia corymbosa var. corymbosa]|uniref:protein-serine/threonine phosphatase n=1 Tax=Oldenlandia corymbosa var. corymbosa TaxID=529605 RepID=A0AAV1BUD7_OLDCO|nr:OLC1v1020862C6 [Oldenlandia corymbosa var. corymbosa]
MALFSPQLQRLFISNYECNRSSSTATKNVIIPSKGRGGRCCSAIAIDAPSSSLSNVVRWGSALVQGAREEMEDDLVVVQSSEDLGGFSFAAVFDGHAGFSSVKFLRNELYKECVVALQGGLLLKDKGLDTVKKALEEAFASADGKLLTWLESSAEEVESGSTATVILIGDKLMIIAHVGDSSVVSSCTLCDFCFSVRGSEHRLMRFIVLFLKVLSRSGKAEVLTNSHRPYGRDQTSLQEIRRVREAGGWINNGRICGDIAVSRAFGDMRFKTKKNEMLEKGVKEGRWSEKFVSRVQFSGDLVTAVPDVSQVALGSDAECAILASDGLWDYISSSDAIDFIRNQLQQHGDVQRACEALAQKALVIFGNQDLEMLL